MENIIDTNKKNVANIEKALGTSERQSKTVLENAETINRMANLLEKQQNEFLKERQKNEELTKDNNHYKTKLINSMSNEISSQKEKIKQMKDEKRRVDARAAEYEQQLVGLKIAQDNSLDDIAMLKEAMSLMEAENADSKSNLIEKLRKADLALIQQTIDLMSIR